MVFVHIQRLLRTRFSVNVIVYSFEFVDGYIFMHLFFIFCIICKAIQITHVSCVDLKINTFDSDLYVW